jgi:hypothetical protein
MVFAGPTNYMKFTTKTITEGKSQNYGVIAADLIIGGT